MRFDGWVDRFQAGTISGWAIDRENPFEPAHLLFSLRGQIIGAGRAEERRPDVAQALQIGARCGFSQLLPPSVIHEPAGIAVSVVDPAAALAVAAARREAGASGVSIVDVLGKSGAGAAHALTMAPDALTGLTTALDHDDLRTRAHAAREAGNWTSAAFFYGKAASGDPKDAALWKHHGDMLKCSGVFTAAEASYARALQLRPDDPDILASLASLALACGELEKATSLFQRGEASTLADTELLRRGSDALRGSGVPASTLGSQDHTTLYLSCAAQMVPDGDPEELKRFLGAAHYSYSYILRGYLEALEEAGYDCRVISHPEYMPDIRSRSRGRNVHIGFYPPDEPRFLKGAYNITCIAWEFERLRNRAEARSYHAFSDAATMLQRSDEVWAISEFGAEAVRKAGMSRVRAVPTPVAARRLQGRARRPSLNEMEKAARKLDRVRWRSLAIIPAIQKKMSEQVERQTRPLSDTPIFKESAERPTVFISIFNVHDYRKQIKPLLESFVRFAQTQPNVHLLLKATSIDSATLDINTQLFKYQVADPGELTPPLVSDRILVTTDTLSRDEMCALNDLASFYVCTSHAEGQNLPLIEAMGAGLVPISVDHTAMRDYVRPGNAIAIPSSLRPMTPRLTARYDLYGVRTYFVDPRDVHAGLSAAVAQSDEAYSAMSGAAVSTVREEFGSGRLIEAIEQEPGWTSAQNGTP